MYVRVLRSWMLAEERVQKMKEGYFSFVWEIPDAKPETVADSCYNMNNFWRYFKGIYFMLGQLLRGHVLYSTAVFN